MLIAKLTRAAALCLPLLAASLTPRTADACGGTFCDAGPQVMPVDQTGETIVFWIDDSGADPYTEAHIQIQYEGDAERFAWIIPVMDVPEVQVSAQALFDNILQGTVPTFRITSRSTGDCGFGGLACAKNEAADLQLGGLGLADDEGGNETDGPQVLDRGFAGAFEYVTLTGDSVAEVVDWLEAAGYAQDDEAPPILQEYLDEGFVFVAVKLRSGADVDEIQPLAIRYPGVEPCIPIRLTRIAAVEDMAIRAVFLGDGRVASSNWPQVIINHARLDYANDPAASYSEIVSLAIDEAGGRGFVTEYAGSDSIVVASSIYGRSWDANAFVEIAVTGVVDELIAQAAMNCALGECSFGNPQVRTLLETYIPVPDTLDPGEFWSCLSCYEELIDQAAWDPLAFAAAFDERVVIPSKHAVDMLDDASYLTRLYTVLSPHEMTEDPLFHQTSGLGEVSNIVEAVRVNDCDGGPSSFELPDGRTVALTDAGNMPELGLPAAERIEQVPMKGPAQIETDNGAEIDAAIAAWNETRVTGPAPNCSVRRVRAEGILTMFAVFGVAWLHRSRRHRTSVS